jgi:hypothetical protein
MILRVNAEMSKGKRLQDYSEDAFMISKNADTSNYLIANMVLLCASQLEENGLYEQSYQEFLRLDPVKLPSYYSTQLILAIMFQELVFFRDEASVQRARERVEAKANDKYFQKILKMKHPAFLPFYAAKKAFLDNDADKAREFITQARKLNSCQQNPGLEYSASLMLDRLEACLEKE